jgi:mannosyltransferase OCH1-like enzyme
MSCIPKNIFQTHKSKYYVLIKPKVLNAMLSWKKWEPEFNYYFYNDNECEKFMREKMGGDIYTAYQRLPMAVMKADLFRYCVIYYYGGIYADADTICKIKPVLFNNNSLLTMVPEPGDNFLCQWVFAAPKSSPILKSIIDLSVERILQIPEIKGEHIIHYLTGPAVFTDGIEKYLKEKNLPIYENKDQYYKYPNPCLKVFHPLIFHQKRVIHLYTGSDNDGWKKERYQKIM